MYYCNNDGNSCDNCGNCNNGNYNNGGNNLGNIWVPIIAIALLGGVFGGWNNGCR